MNPKSAAASARSSVRNLRLKEALATKVVEADFLQGMLRRIEARRQPTATGVYLTRFAIQTEQHSLAKIRGKSGRVMKAGSKT